MKKNLDKVMLQFFKHIIKYPLIIYLVLKIYLLLKGLLEICDDNLSLILYMENPEISEEINQEAEFKEENKGEKEVDQSYLYVTLGVGLLVICSAILLYLYFSGPSIPPVELIEPTVRENIWIIKDAYSGGEIVYQGHTPPGPCPLNLNPEIFSTIEYKLAGGYYVVSINRIV